MKKLLIFIGLVSAALVTKAQTNFIGANGAILRNSTAQAYTNSGTSGANQVIFSAIIPANSMIVDKPYQFICDLSITSPALTLPSISFNVVLGTQTAYTFVSSALIVANLTGVSTTISGYVVRRADGTVLAKFSVAPSGSGLSPLTVTTGNVVGYQVWSGVNFAVDNNFTVNLAFTSVLSGNTTITRQMYVRSDF